MKIALVGYGKMGKAVETLAQVEGHHCFMGLSQEAEVCIDFSTGGAVKETALLIETPWILGTTGWNREEILSIARDREIPLLYGPNFSIGVALFRHMARMGKALFNDFEIEGTEIHHAEKKDAPSGTALRMMEEIKGLKFTSRRAGTEVGTHQILFKGDGESVAITHKAHDRLVFARGALRAAHWLIGKKGVYTFDDFIEDFSLCHLPEPQQL